MFWRTIYILLPPLGLEAEAGKATMGSGACAAVQLITFSQNLDTT